MPEEEVRDIHYNVSSCITHVYIKIPYQTHIQLRYIIVVYSHT